MFKSKKKIKPVPAPAFALDVPRVQAGYADIFEQLSGRSDGPLYNVDAVPLDTEVWLVRTYRADPYRLVMHLGDDWFELASVRPDDPAVKSLFEAGHIVEYGPSPAQIEKQRAKEEEDRQRLELEEGHKRARQEYHMHLRAEAEARERLAREEIRAGM